jgi:transcription elongation GreA/GreB family factor
VDSIKHNIKSEILNLLEQKIQDTSNAITSLKESRDSDTKSSAGDKHETSRAKIQTEIDQLSKQLNHIQRQKNNLSAIDTHHTHNVADVGSLVKTDKGYFFISIGWGRIQIQDGIYFVISIASPIGKLFKDKKKGDSIQFRNMSYDILSVG